jgi:DNA primase
MDWTAGREDLSTADGKARASRFLAETISRVRDAALRKFLIQEAAEKLGVDEGTMILAIEQIPRPSAGRDSRRAPSSGGTAPAFDPHPRSERELLILMMNDGALADAVLEQIEIEEFSNSAYRAILALIAGCRRNSQDISPAQLVDQCKDPDLAHVISDLSMETGILDPDQLEVPLEDYIRKFRLRSLETRIDAVEADIRSAGSGPDLRPLMEKHRALTAQRKALVESA